MSPKELVISSIQQLPDDASLEQIARWVRYITAIQKEINALDRGAAPREKMKKRLAAWLPE